MTTKQQPELIAAKEEGRDPVASPVIVMEDDLKNLRDQLSHNETVKGEKRVDDVNDTTGITEEVEKLLEDSSTKDKQTICPEEGLVPNQEENKRMVDGAEIKTQETVSQGEWKTATEANEEVVTAERKEDPIRGIIHKAEIDDMLPENDNYVTNDDIFERSAIEQTNEAIKETDKAADKFEIFSIVREDHLAAQPAKEVDGDIKGSNEQETAVEELSNNTVSHLENLVLRESTKKLREDGELNPDNGTTTDHKKNDVFTTTERSVENDDKKPTEERNVEEPKHDATPVQTENDSPAEEEATARYIEEKEDELLFTATKPDVETTTAVSTKIEDENGNITGNLTPTETLAQYNISEGRPVHPEIKIADDCEENKDVAMEDTSADNESAKIPSENEDATSDQTGRDCPAEEEKGEMHIEEITREPQLQGKAAQFDGSYSDEKVETTDYISPKIDEEENVVKKFSSVNDTNTYLDNLASGESPETLQECKIPEGNPVDADNIKTAGHDPENATSTNKQMPIEVELAEEPLQHATPDKKENDPAESDRQHVMETTRELELQEEADELLSRSTETDVVSLKEDETVELEHCKTPDQTENGCPAEEEMGERHVKEEPREQELQEEADAGFSDESGVENQKKHRDNSTIENYQLPHNEPLKGENRVDDVNCIGEEEIQPRHELSFDTMKEGEEDKAKIHVKTERENNYAANYITGEVEKLAEDSSTKKDKQILCPEGLVPNQEENKYMVDGGEIKTQETLSQTIPLSLVGDGPVEENLKQGEWKVETEANEVENEKLEVIPAERKEEDPIRGIIHKDQEAEIDDMLQENDNYVTNDDKFARSAIEQTNEEIKEPDEAADKFEISSIAKEDHLEEVETSKVITSKPDGDSEGSNEQETVSPLEKLALRESTEKLSEDNELNPANGTTTDHKKNDVFATTNTETDRSENADKKPTEEENVEESKHNATPVHTENDCPAEEGTTARHIEEMATEQELHEKNDELLFAATKTDVETNTSPDNLTPIERVETLAQYNVSEGKSVHPEIKITADCEKNKDVALEDTSAHNESVKIPSEDENIEELNEDATPGQSEKDCPGEEKGQMHIEETREPELKEIAAQLLPKTTKADICYSDEKVETTDFISSKIDKEETIVMNLSSVNDTNTYFDNLASRESPETLKQSKIPEGSPVDVESINKHMPIKVELAEEALQHATPDKNENDPAEAESRNVVETARELELQEESDELLTGTKKKQMPIEDEYIEEKCLDGTLEQTEFECSAEEETKGSHAKGNTRELEISVKADELLGRSTKTEITLKEDETVEHCQGTTPDQTENGCPAEEDMGERHVKEETSKLELQEEADGLPMATTKTNADTGSSDEKMPSEGEIVEEPRQDETLCNKENYSPAEEETGARKLNIATEEFQEQPLTEYKFSDDNLVKPDKVTVVDHEMNDVGVEEMTTDTSENTKAENSNVISSNAVEDINGSNEQETIAGDLSKGNDIAAHLENLTLRESPEQLWKHNELTPANGTTTSYIKTDDFVMTETGADSSENDDKKPREDCNVEKLTEGKHIVEITREPEPHAKDDELQSGARKNDVETSEAISTKIGEDENITGKLSPAETPVNQQNKTYAGCEKNKDGALKDMGAEQESAKMSSTYENVEEQNRDETPDQTEHDCPAEDEKRERHIEEMTREAGLQEEDNELLFKNTKAGVSYADEKMPIEDEAVEEPPLLATLEKTENDPAEGRYVNETSREQEIQEENIDEEENSTGTSENAKIPRSKDENIEEQCQDETLEKRELDHSTEEETRERHAKEITRELELQEEADELPMATKTDVGYSDEKVETFKDMSPNNYEDENIVHKLSEVEPAEEPLQHATPDKKENDPEEAESGRQHVVETSRELELQEDELLIGTKKEEADELSMATKTDVDYSDEKVETFEDMSPKNYEDENIVHKLSEVEPAEEPLQHATPDKKENDPEEAESGRQHVVETSRELELQEDELLIGTKKMPSEEEIVEELHQDATLSNKEKYSHVEEEMGTRHVNTATEKLQKETLMGYKFSDENLVKQDKITIADHEKDDVGVEDMTPDTSEYAKLPSEENAVEGPSRDATPHQLEIDCSATEETREMHDKENTRELELSEVAGELLRGTTSIDASPLNEEVQTSKVLSTNIDEEENIYEKPSLVNDANTYEGGNPVKRDDKINTDHESSSIIKEDYLAEQPAEEKDKKELELKAKDLDFNMAEKVENSNVIPSNADEESKVSNEHETIVGDLSKVNNIVTPLENLTLRESPEQLREHSELTPAKGTITTHEKTDNFVMTETGAVKQKNDDKKQREDETVEEPNHDETLAQTENYCNVEEETAGGHTKEITRELELHEKDDVLLSGPRITDVEISKAISKKIGEDETNTKLDDLTPTDSLETLVQYNVSEGKPVNPEYKNSPGCEKNKDFALENISADQERAKSIKKQIPTEDDETVEEQNKEETPDQSPAEDEMGERHIEETTRESELQEEEDELLFKTTKVGVSFADEKADTNFVTPKIDAEENAIRKFSSVNDTNTYIDSSPEGNPENADGSKKTITCENNDDIAKEDMSSHSAENATMSIDDEAVEEPPQHATLEKTENSPSEGRYVKETTKEQETQEEVDESLIVSKKTDLDSFNINEEENNTGKLSLVNDSNNADTHENAKIPSEDENIEEQCQDETLEKREFDRSAEEEATESHAKETTRELELQEEADKLPVATKTDADVGSSDEKIPSEDENIEEQCQDETLEKREFDRSAEEEATESHAKETTRELELQEEAGELPVATKTDADVGSSDEKVEIFKDMSPKNDEDEKIVQKFSPTNDANTNVNDLTSTTSAKNVLEYNISTENIENQDNKNIVVFEKDNNAAMEDVDTSENAKMSSEEDTVEDPYNPAEVETGKKHVETVSEELNEKVDELVTSKVIFPTFDEKENVPGKLSQVNATNTYLDSQTSTEAPGTLTGFTFSDEKLVKPDKITIVESSKGLELQEEADKLQTATAKTDLGSSFEKVEKPENQDNKNKADHENNDSTAREEMSADTIENAKMPSEIEAVEEPFQDETPGKKEIDCPAEEETGIRLIKTTREELQEEAEVLIPTMNRPDVGSSNEKVETSKAVFLKIDEEENVPGNLLLVNDTNTYLDSQTSIIAPKTLTEFNVSEALPIKLDKTTIADNEKNILTEDETGKRPDKEPTREVIFQEEADDLLLGTTKTDVSSLNEKTETSTTISPKIYEVGNVVGKLSLASQQSPEISMEHDTLTIGGQEKNDNDNMEDMSADTGDNAKGIEKQIPKEDKSVGETFGDATVDQTGKHGHAEEETNERHVKVTTNIPEIQQDDHDLLTGAIKTEIDISKVMSPKADEGSKVSIDQENIAEEYQQESNKTTDMDNLASKESQENSIEYSVFEGQAGSAANLPTSDQEKSNDDVVVDINPLSLVESEKPRNPVDEFSCNSTSFTRDLNFEDQEDSAEGDDKHKGEESKRTGKMEDHIVTQLESKEEAFSKENETSSEVDSMKQQNEEITKLPTMTHDMTQDEDAILGRNVQTDKEELQSESSSKIVPESREVKHEQDERKIDESKNIAEKCITMESDPILKSSLNETSREEILQASEDRENQNPCEDSPTDTDKYVAQAVTKPNDDKVVFVQQEMETLDSPHAIKAVLGEKGDYHKDDNFINDSNIKTGELESVTYPQSTAYHLKQSNKDIPQEQDKKGAMEEPESFHVSSDSNELVTSVSSHKAILNTSSVNDVLNMHQKVSADISLSEEDNKEQGKTVQDEVTSREEDVKPKSQELALKEEFLEDGKTRAVESEGPKTDQDEGKYNEETKAESADDIPVIVEATSISDDKAVQKKSHNILSGVGSKVKHSIAKVKKAITGKHSNQKPHST